MEKSVLNKPIIGIVAKYRENRKSRQEAMVRDEIRRAIICSGGIAIGILSSNPELDFARGKAFDEISLTIQQKQGLIHEISLCDGIVLQGGTDSCLHERWIAKYAYDNNIPILGFCSGQSNMIRALGGTIKKIGNHNCPDKEYAHEIFIDKNSKFFKIVKTTKMRVNSRHDFAVKDKPGAYNVAATSEDGCLEVLEAPDKDFNFAIKFHPESLFDKDKNCKAIFDAFIEACRRRSNEG